MTGDEAPIPDASEDVVLDEEAAAEIVESDLAQLEGERAELLDMVRRLQADFENYRKRAQREQAVLVERANERLLEELLPVLDSFDGAVSSLANPAGGEVDVEKLRNGVLGIHTQLVAVVQKNGLERIEAAGAPFDPNEHEAVMQDDGDGEPHVAQVMRTGYRMKGRVLRPAMVSVTRN
ncbi:MAG: nucleotide exchange factor GrpE [Acidimicrobiia bacterium]